jgi:hypothetical protein
MTNGQQVFKLVSHLELKVDGKGKKKTLGGEVAKS